MNLESVTVVIPAHNRPEKLRRLLHYYSDTNIQILVSDSSKVVFPFLNEFPGLNYFHFPNEEFLRKINRILPYLKTNYTVYCADDDFAVPQAIGKIVNFLDQNPDYSSAQGHYLSVEIKNNALEFFPGYIRNFEKDVNQNLPSERLPEYRNLYASTLYSVIRTKIFVEMYEKCIEREILKFKNLFLAESYFNFFALMAGKNRTLPVFYSVREKDYNSATYSTVPLSVIRSSPLYAEEYRNFLNIITNHLVSQENIALKTAEDLITGILNDPKKNHIHPIKRKILNLMEKYGPNELIKSYSIKKYKDKGLRLTQGMQSIPCTFSTPEKDRIIEHILKYK